MTNYPAELMHTLTRADYICGVDYNNDNEVKQYALSLSPETITELKQLHATLQQYIHVPIGMWATGVWTILDIVIDTLGN